MQISMFFGRADPGSLPTPPKTIQLPVERDLLTSTRPHDIVEIARSIRRANAIG